MPTIQTKPTTCISQSLKNNYYHSLNGFRGISIILVVIYHLHLFNGVITNYIFNGRLGVGIFFVLSGFLITTLCLKEKELTNDISLSSFYVRRLLRIFPIAYLYLIVIIILNVIYNLGIPRFQFVGAALYLMDFSYFRSHSFTQILSHYWSLAVEEQFYILFPFILKINRRLFLYSILFVVFALPVIYTIQEACPAINHGVLYYFTHFLIKFQCIAVGCLFALLAFSKAFDSEWIMKTKILGNVLAIFLIFYLNFDDFYTVKTTYINLIISVLVGYLIITNLLVNNDWIFRFLNTRVMSFIGILSYSIYIWHMLFASFDAKLPGIFSNIPYNIPGLIIVPLLSYFFFEKYFLNLKKRFSRVK
ncbi:acyltransferase family protein [Mucilaginibacter lappiensis]|uniref:Peptidoglycan/LPS O-acetylase OafA/YrhL n=1 Tax=Mucilaginibacter lappiensis TaxID=354630 RepID=A0A841JRU1_9SPHI|nr:acyltransferase [Mucilaginibacter lappiensis]MBB6130571.1 peptidoglycan/LPS O-acetylase OafA/YrhL [Mucilaginibacter lappiensis]